MRKKISKKEPLVLNKYFVLERTYDFHRYSFGLNETVLYHWKIVQKDGVVVTTDNPDVYMRENPQTTPVMFVETARHLVAELATRQETVIDNIKTTKLEDYSGA